MLQLLLPTIYLQIDEFTSNSLLVLLQWTKRILTLCLALRSLLFEAGLQLVEFAVTFEVVIDHYLLLSLGHASCQAL